jgi:anti-anti-sigma factor
VNGLHKRVGPVVDDGQASVWVEPGLIRIAGEIDVANVEVIGDVLAGVSPEHGELVVDLSGLSFIDLTGARRLIELARRLAPREHLKVVHPPASLKMILDAVGWREQLDVEPNGGTRGEVA